ncbi:hypothetical protein CDD83_1948 [Cordyceps sp. RAO-2017]|nr:hypothetical protein CDD83_1948 [Cordyceps sp. RAO-2017]
MFNDLLTLNRADGSSGEQSYAGSTTMNYMYVNAWFPGSQRTRLDGSFRYTMFVDRSSALDTLSLAFHQAAPPGHGRAQPNVLTNQPNVPTSDLKTIIVLSAICGLPAHPVDYVLVLILVPVVLLWVWANQLQLAINNQVDPLSAAEDAIKEPWRIPTQRLLCVAASPNSDARIVGPRSGRQHARLGAPREGTGLLLLGIWYNNFGGANSGP